APDGQQDVWFAWAACWRFSASMLVNCWRFSCAVLALIAMSHFQPAQTHLSLGDAFFDAVTPADFPQTILRHRDQRWAKRMGLDGLSDKQWLAHFGRFTPLPGSLPHPLALRYHGHQFRSYNADLGDGRG